MAAGLGVNELRGDSILVESIVPIIIPDVEIPNPRSNPTVVTVTPVNDVHSDKYSKYESIGIYEIINKRISNNWVMVSAIIFVAGMIIVFCVYRYLSRRRQRRASVLADIDKWIGEAGDE